MKSKKLTIEERLELARTFGKRKAWKELMSRFDKKKRGQIANLLAHGFEITAIEIRGPYTPKDSPSERFES